MEVVRVVKFLGSNLCNYSNYLVNKFLEILIYNTISTICQTVQSNNIQDLFAKVYQISEYN